MYKSLPISGILVGLLQMFCFSYALEGSISAESMVPYLLLPIIGGIAGLAAQSISVFRRAFHTGAMACAGLAAFFPLLCLLDIESGTKVYPWIVLLLTLSSALAACTHPGKKWVAPSTAFFITILLLFGPEIVGDRDWVKAMKRLMAMNKEEWLVWAEVFVLLFVGIYTLLWVGQAILGTPRRSYKRRSSSRRKKG